MRRLVIHIGLPKTATTSLQTHIFPHLPGYLGKFAEVETYPSTALWGLRHLWSSGALIDNKQVFEIDGRPVWVPALESWVEELVASDEDILLWSEEELTQWRSPEDNAADWPVMVAPEVLPRRGSHPIVGFLQHLHELLPRDVELKTILVLRNQSDWLISLAAQLAVSNIGFVERLIRDDDAFLDYYAITKDLERLRGPENHLTLLFENGLEHNVQEALEFASYSPANIPNLQMSQSRENVRKGDAGWSVQRLAPLQQLERALMTLRHSSSFLDKQLTSNQALRRTFRPIIGSEARQRTLGWIPAVGKQVNISLTEEQRAAIKSHCAASNERLSAHLNVDLKALGY